MCPMDMVRVSVKHTGSTRELLLDVPRQQTVGETKRMVQELDASLATEELRLNGTFVDDATLLEELMASHSEPLVFTAERRTLEVSAGPVRRKKRCSFAKCSSAPLRGVGDCTMCQGTFCSRHRLMEQHDCAGLPCCKKEAHQRNASRLQQQQTVAHKV